MRHPRSRCSATSFERIRLKLRELALLDAYFKALRQVEVSLTMGRDTVEPPRRFIVQDGRWAELRQVLCVKG